MNWEKTEALIKSGLRSIAASIPGAASVAQAWNEYESVIQERRTSEFFDVLREQMTNLETRLVEVEEHTKASGEIPALMEGTIERVRREADARKRKAFAALLANSIAAGPRLSYDHKLTLLETLDSLTQQDVTLLSQFQTNQPVRVDSLISTPGRQSIGTTGFGEGSPDRQLSSLIVSLSKLDSRGLIGETVDRGGAFGGSGDIRHWSNRWRRRSFELLPFGDLFKRMITGATQQ